MSPVVFWALPTNSTPIATVCIPTIMFHLADVLLNTTSSALLEVSNEGPLTGNDSALVDQSVAPFNGSAYNGYNGSLVAFYSCSLMIVVCHRLFFGNAPSVESQLNLNSTRYSLGVAVTGAFQRNDSTLSNADVHSQITADIYSHCKYPP